MKDLGALHHFCVENKNSGLFLCQKTVSFEYPRVCIHDGVDTSPKLGADADPLVVDAT